jgi:hypothetical protein
VALVSCNVQLERVGTVRKWMNRIFKRAEKTTEDGIERAAYFLLARSQELCPVDTGALKASGRVIKRGHGANTECIVAYGSDEIYYAVYVHEDTSKYHEWPTQAKWLEEPARRYRTEMGRIASGRVQTRLSLAL